MSKDLALELAEQQSQQLEEAKKKLLTRADASNFYVHFEEVKPIERPNTTSTLKNFFKRKSD